MWFYIPVHLDAIFFPQADVCTEKEPEFRGAMWAQRACVAAAVAGFVRAQQP
jgi:hypothetical protein